jgi:hypothetical protein
MSSFLRPAQLDEISSEIEAAKLDEDEQYKRKKEQTKRELREAFLARDIHPEVVDRVNNAVRIAARQGHRQLEVMTFPCSYCNDGGGASTTCCPTGRRRSRASPSGTEFYERGAEAAGLQGHRPSCELRGRSARQHHHVPQMVSCSSMSRSDMKEE